MINLNQIDIRHYRQVFDLVGRGELVIPGQMRITPQLRRSPRIQNLYNDMLYTYTDYAELTPPNSPPRARRGQAPPAKKPPVRKSKALSKKDFHAEMPDPCGVCFEGYTKGTSVLRSCSHSFCKDCTSALEQRQIDACPLCRQTHTSNITEFRLRKTPQPRAQRGAPCAPCSVDDPALVAGPAPVRVRVRRARVPVPVAVPVADDDTDIDALLSRYGM